MIIFLGNKGEEYKNTRHNAGWLCADNLLPLRGEPWQKKFNGEYTQFIADSRKIMALKPQTFMNKSGQSAVAATTFFKIKREEILVVHDDLEMNFGQISWRKDGGLGGHNGLKSLDCCLGGKDFYRLRIGIGRPVHGSVASWVTSRFSKEEEIHLSLILTQAASVIEKLISGDRSNEGKKSQLITP